MADIELIELIKKIIAELQTQKKGKTQEPVSTDSLGVSNPIKMKRATYKTQINELKDRIRIKNLEKELLKRDVAQTTQAQRDFMIQFLNSRVPYEDNGYTVEEPDEESYTNPLQPTTRGFSMNDSFGAFGETAGSDRFLTQRSPFQLQSTAMSQQQPLELASPSEEQQPAAAAYMPDQPEVFEMGSNEYADFGVDPTQQADYATPYFDQSEQQPQDIELPQVISRPPISREDRLLQVRAKYRDIAGTDLDPAIYRSRYVRDIDKATRDILLQKYVAAGGNNPVVLKSKKVGLIETELKYLKDVSSI